MEYKNLYEVRAERVIREPFFVVASDMQEALNKAVERVEKLKFDIDYIDSINFIRLVIV